MKAERRHELKHNQLADWLEARIEGIRPHATGILLGLALLAAIILASAFYFSGETHASASAWSAYFDAFNDRDPQRVLQDLATKQSGSKAAWWAQAALGDMNLSEGTSLLYSDRKEAQKRLEAAEAAYKQVEQADDPMLKSRARLGLARVYESLFKPDDARKYYEQVAASEKDSPLGKQAAADAKRLKDSREIAFLDWFATQTPKRPVPFPGVGANVPNLPSDLPERPNLELPKSLGLDNIGTGAPSEPPPAFPSPLGTSPAPVTPDAATSDATKAGETKPADAPAPPATVPDTAKPAEPSPDAKTGDKKSD
jgi:tetratricopeptide (TPR) repeat protein